MLRALAERGIVPDLVVGCSVGALNGVAYCQDPTVDGVNELEDLWRSLDAKQLMPNGWLPIARQLARKGSAVLNSNEGLRRVIESILRVRTFDELAIRFQCVATAVEEAKETWFVEGPLVPAVLASSAIPAVYPPVTVDGVRYVDGAVVNDVPISRAVELGARRLYVLHVGSFDRPRREARRPLDMAVQAYWIARRHRFHRDLATLPAGVEAVVLRPGEARTVSFHDFSRTEELMKNAYVATTAMLSAIA